jgi:hydrogenase nickel incorporation protein HypA/HybF
MHEMALCQGMLDIIDAKRVSEHFDQVRCITLEVGVLGHVDPHALRFAFDVSARGTAAETARLDIVEVPGRAWCMDCSESIAIAARGEGCPSCGGFVLIVEQGEELRLKELEVV